MPPSSAQPTLSSVGEFRIIAGLARRFGHTNQAILRGIGDDAAVVRSAASERLLASTDLLTEGIHFDLAYTSFYALGYRAAVANLSDIAAMGGLPRYFLVAVAAPPFRTQSELEALYRGMMRAGRPFGIRLIGGDTSASCRDLCLCPTVLGTVEPTHVMYRSGARQGDYLYVTGTLGDSLAGFQILRRTAGKDSPGDRGSHRALKPHERHLIKRHLFPTPRIPEGRLFSTRRLATAAIDISDGLAGDLGHLTEQSGVGAELEASTIPISPALRKYAAERGLDAVEVALTGGEDYELLVAVPPRQAARLERLATQRGHTCTRIGIIRSKRFGLRLRDEHGKSRRVKSHSYQHFTMNGKDHSELWCSR